MPAIDSMLENALEYARYGWPVFPCRPGSKVPLTPRGFKDATTDESVIKAWWERWPDAPIAVPTGEASGVVVIDIDARNDGEATFEALVTKHGAVPHTLEVLTGGGGRHLYFQWPEGRKFPNSAGALGPGIDSRGTGGYVLVPYSSHPSGKRYEWELSSSPENSSAAPLPEWLWPNGTAAKKALEIVDGKVRFDATMVRPITDEAPVHVGERNVTCASLVGRWIADGATLLETLERALAWNRTCSEPLDDGEVRRVVESIAKTAVRNDPTASVEVVREDPAPPAARVATQPPSLPADLHTPPGYVGELCAWLAETAIYPQPILNLANALSFFGAVLGRKVRTPSDLRTNLYCLGVGESGCGKDHSRKQIKRLAEAAGLTGEMMGGEEVSSDSAILRAVSTRNSVLFQFDEIGHMLGASLERHAAHYLRAIPSLLTRLYSSASTTFLGREYADEKANPRKDIPQPNVCIYGTTVPHRLYDALSPDEIRDGFLGRLLVFRSDDPAPERRKIDIEDVPEGLIIRIQGWWTRDDLQPKVAGNLSSLTNIPYTVRLEERAEAILDSFHAECSRERVKAISSIGIEAFWTRAGEHAAKIALVIGCGQDFAAPSVSEATAEYAVKLTRFLVKDFIRQARESIVSSEFERERNRVMQVIRSGGEEGVTWREISRGTASIDPRARKIILEDLLATGEVAKREPQKGGRGQPGVRFYACEDHKTSP